ncbi:unnamed protein product [Leuciscus chuanchicus]
MVERLKFFTVETQTLCYVNAGLEMKRQESQAVDVSRDATSFNCAFVHKTRMESLGMIKATPFSRARIRALHINPLGLYEHGLVRNTNPDFSFKRRISSLSAAGSCPAPCNTRFRGERDESPFKSKPCACASSRWPDRFTYTHPFANRDGTCRTLSRERRRAGKHALERVPVHTERSHKPHGMVSVVSPPVIPLGPRPASAGTNTICAATIDTSFTLIRLSLVIVIPAQNTEFSRSPSCEEPHTTKLRENKNMGQRIS